MQISCQESRFHPLIGEEGIIVSHLELLVEKFNFGFNVALENEGDFCQKFKLKKTFGFKTPTTTPELGLLV